MCQSSPYRGFGAPPAAQVREDSWKPYYKSNLGILIWTLSIPFIILWPFLFLRDEDFDYDQFHIGIWTAFPKHFSREWAVVSLLATICFIPCSSIGMLMLPILLKWQRVHFYHPLLRMKAEWEEDDQ